VAQPSRRMPGLGGVRLLFRRCEPVLGWWLIARCSHAHMKNAVGSIVAAMVCARKTNARCDP
jgi:hypothetical protein